MKILFITHYSAMYGANKSLLQLIIELREIYKIDPVVLLPKVGELKSELIKNKISYIILPYYKWVYHKTKFKVFEKNLYEILNKIYYKKILETIKKEEIQLIHSNSSVINIGGKLSKDLDIPHIWHIREYGEEDYNLLFNLGYERAGKYIEENSSKIIAISSSIKNKYRNYIKEEKIELVYNGIKIENISETKEKFNLNLNKKIEFVLIGVLHENKNQLEALKAVKILKEKFGKKNFILNIIGDGKSYKKEILKYIKNNSLDENIKIWGYTNKVDEILKTMDVGILTSKKEAFGRVTIEMMLKFLPIIGTNTGATPELIDEKCGYLYESGEVEILANYMNIFIKDRNLLKEMGLNSREKAVTFFSSKKNTQKIYSIYESVKKDR